MQLKMKKATHTTFVLSRELSTEHKILFQPLAEFKTEPSFHGFIEIYFQECIPNLNFHAASPISSYKFYEFL